MEVCGSSKMMGKGKGKGKSSAAVSAAKGSDKPVASKITVAKVPPKLIPLPFFNDTPAEGMLGAKKHKKDEGSKDKT